MKKMKYKYNIKYMLYCDILYLSEPKISLALNLLKSDNPVIGRYSFLRYLEKKLKVKLSTFHQNAIKQHFIKMLFISSSNSVTQV